MIDSTVIKMGPVEIGEHTYIGPNCILGFPLSDEITHKDMDLNNNNRPLSNGMKIKDNCTILSNVVIGENSTIESNVWCDHYSYIGCLTKISNKVQIMYGAKIYHRVIIGEKAWIGEFVCNDAVIEPNAIVLGKLVHKFVNAVEGVPEKAPVIREGAFIGMNAVVIGDVEVGAGAYIAAGAVLTEPARPGRLYMGVPAKDSGTAPSAFNINERR